MEEEVEEEGEEEEEEEGAGERRIIVRSKTRMRGRRKTKKIRIVDQCRYYRKMVFPNTCNLLIKNRL